VKFTANTGTRAEPEFADEIKEPVAGLFEDKLTDKPVAGAVVVVVVPPPVVVVVVEVIALTKARVFGPK
jgi:hypothetical protein